MASARGKLFLPILEFLSWPHILVQCLFPEAYLCFISFRTLSWGKKTLGICTFELRALFLTKGLVQISWMVGLCEASHASKSFTKDSSSGEYPVEMGFKSA